MDSEGLTKETILKALGDLSAALAEHGAKGEVCLFGGTVMVLAYSARVATKDVDAIFQPASLIRQIAAQIGDHHKLPGDWLNDGVKGFISVRHDVTEGDLPQYPSLRLTMPTAEYLLAMKCMASRISQSGGERGDVEDIIFLIRHLKLASAGAALAIVEEYYPPNQIPVKARYLVEGLFDEGKI